MTQFLTEAEQKETEEILLEAGWITKVNGKYELSKKVIDILFGRNDDLQE
jgi:hypothetical protein